MYVRRLVKAGQASHTISLPKDWLEKNKLQKGDMVYITEHTDTDLMLSPQKRETVEVPREIVIPIGGKDLGSIQRELTSAYLNNYNTIVLTGDNPTALKQVREMIHNFIALEISEQTTTKIVAKDLLNLQEISIPKTIRRLDMILRSLIKDAQAMPLGGKVHESIAFRDEDINRLYFMIFRLLKKALGNPDVAQKFELSSANILSTWYLIHNLENMGDALAQVCALKETVATIKDEAVLASLHEDIDIGFKDVMKAYFNHDKSLANQVAGRWPAFADKANGIFEKNKTPDMALMKEQLKQVFSQISNVARIVMDEENAQGV